MSMKGKRVLVTGATDGIGLRSAIRLAEMGASLHIAGRNPEKLARASALVAEAAGGAPPAIYLADLSTMEGVRSLADAVKTNCTSLDVLLNNAGAIFPKRQVTADGLEATFALDHLSYFLLTHLLLDTLKAAPGRARVVNVASAAHRGAKLDFDDLQSERGYSAWRAYQRAKLCNLYFTYELAGRVDPAQIKVNCLHPGFVASNFGGGAGGLFGWVLGAAKRLAAIDPAKGAETPVYLCSSPELEDVSGRYFDKCKAVPSSEQSYDVEARKHLWAVSERLTGIMP